MVKETEYYDILGVSPDANETQIKKGYRKAALKWHPDKHSMSTPEMQAKAEEMFKEITKAHEVLSNPETRRLYDQLGEEGLEQSGRAPNMDDIFRHMSGMGFPFGQRQQRRRELRMPNLTCRLEMSLPEIYDGTKAEFKVERYVLKKDVDPSIQDLVCQTCRGQGQQVRMEQIGPGMMRQYQSVCDPCKGEGIILNEEYFDKVEKTLRKTIPRGVIHKHQIIIPNYGHEIPPSMQKNGITKTDLVIVVKEEQTYQVPNTDITYVRGEAGSPFNLQVNLELEPELAICGGYKELEFIDGSIFLVEIPPGLVFQDTPTVVVPQKGLPVYGVTDIDNQNKYGDLFVKFSLNTEGMTNKIYGKIYQAMTGKSKNDVEKEMRDSHSGSTELSLPLDEYAESERLDQVKQDFRQFNRYYETERRSTMERRMREDNTGSNNDEFGGRGFEAQFEGEGPPNCATQ